MTKTILERADVCHSTCTLSAVTESEETVDVAFRFYRLREMTFTNPVFPLA